MRLIDELYDAYLRRDFGERIAVDTLRREAIATIEATFACMDTNEVRHHSRPLAVAYLALMCESIAVDKCYEIIDNAVHDMGYCISDNWNIKPSYKDAMEKTAIDTGEMIKKRIKEELKSECD